MPRALEDGKGLADLAGDQIKRWATVGALL